MENYNIPHQVQQLIESLLNKKDNVHLRGNYRIRLDQINMAINAAIKKYDNEVLTDNMKKQFKRIKDTQSQ